MNDWVRDLAISMKLRFEQRDGYVLIYRNKNNGEKGERLIGKAYAMRNYDKFLTWPAPRVWNGRAAGVYFEWKRGAYLQLEIEKALVGIATLGWDGVDR